MSHRLDKQDHRPSIRLAPFMLKEHAVFVFLSTPITGFAVLSFFYLQNIVPSAPAYKFN